MYSPFCNCIKEIYYEYNFIAYPKGKFSVYI